MYIFTFHYASTLSHRSIHSPSLRMIYIPLCFYFIALLICNTRCLPQIYIPLCFYFIMMPQEKKITLSQHLHSTMLLLYLIPLLRVVSKVLIYIPLWFYFITHRNLNAHGRNLHLHSTMLLLYLGKTLATLRKNKLTFHYASTLSTLTDGVLGAVPHLHSTMLLLYRIMLSCSSYRI